MKLLALAFVVVPGIALAGDPAASKQPAPPAKPAKPSPELAELAGSLNGTWKCTGKSSPDGTTMIDSKATISNRSDLDTWWQQTNFTATMGKATYKFTGFTGYNDAEKKFYRYMVDNMGGSEWDTAASIDHGMAGKWAITWDGEMRLGMGMPAGKNVVKTKHTESMSKDGLAISGEMSIDGGKTWLKSYDALCKK